MGERADIPSYPCRVDQPARPAFGNQSRPCPSRPRLMLPPRLRCPRIARACRRKSRRRACAVAGLGRNRSDGRTRRTARQPGRHGLRRRQTDHHGCTRRYPARTFVDTRGGRQPRRLSDFTACGGHQRIEYLIDGGTGRCSFASAEAQPSRAFAPQRIDLRPHHQRINRT